jgi:hypothetical protein
MPLILSNLRAAQPAAGTAGRVRGRER